MSAIDGRSRCAAQCLSAAQPIVPLHVGSTQLALTRSRECAGGSAYRLCRYEPHFLVTRELCYERGTSVGQVGARFQLRWWCRSSESQPACDVRNADAVRPQVWAALWKSIESIISVHSVGRFSRNSTLVGGATTTRERRCTKAHGTKGLESVTMRRPKSRSRQRRHS